MRTFDTHAGKTIARAAAVVAATGGAALALAAPASAAIYSDQYIEVSNCHTQSEVCAGIIPTVSAGPAISVGVSFTANANHCADMRAHFLANGQEFGSGVVGASQTTDTFYVPQPSMSAPTTIGVLAEGIPGGCNPGSIYAWGGVVHIEQSGGMS